MGDPNLVLTDDHEVCNEHLTWVAQRVHQAYHETGTWRDCPKDVCASVRHAGYPIPSNGEVRSTADFARGLGEWAEYVTAADRTTATDPDVMANATALAKALEGFMIDGRTITGEFPAVVDPTPEDAAGVVRGTGMGR